MGVDSSIFTGLADQTAVVPDIGRKAGQALHIVAVRKVGRALAFLCVWVHDLTQDGAWGLLAGVASRVEDLPF